MDIWYYPRIELAEKYLKVLNAGISSNLAIIAPRRKGKTLFVLNDISSLARKENYIPVYASLWQNINAPHEGLILAFEETLEALDKKISFSRLLSTKIKKTSLGNELIGKVEVEFADNPEKPDNKNLILLDQLLTKLQKKAKNKTVLLLIDEIQHLATSHHFDSLTHALRTMLDKRLGKVKAIFTGSSRHYMNLLFNESQSPFYHFVETVPFPDLSDEFIKFLSENLHKRHHKSLSKEELQRTFAAVDQSPYWMMKVISYMITFEETLNSSLDYVMQLIEAAEGFEQIAKKLKPIDKIVFLALSSGHSPFSKELLQKIDRETSVKGVYPNVQRSLKRLKEQHLVTQISKGEYEIEKPGFKEYLTKIFIC
jgi:2-hydroxy-3-keto-5-methylthiopentenyl-1-phosphate phosphatase